MVSAREVRISLPETVRPAIGSWARASAMSQAVPSPAQLRQLAAAADPVTRTFEARYVLTGTAAAAPLGSTMTVQLPGAPDAGRHRVPLGALRDAGGGWGVWVIQPSTQRVRFRPLVLTMLIWQFPVCLKKTLWDLRCTG